jgi:DNA processing protein
MIDRDEFSAWLRVPETPGVGGQAARALLASFGSPDAVLAASTAARGDGSGAVRGASGRRLELAASWRRAARRHRPR